MPKKKNEDNRKTQKYWEKRARLDKLKVIKTGEQGIDNLKKLLSYNLKSVQRQIKEFYEKYGDNPAENLSYEEFKQYKRKLGLKAKNNPQDKTLQRIARQDIPKYRIDRLRALETDLQIMLTEATNGQQRGIYNTLKDVASVSEATAVKRFANGLDLVFDRIAGKKLQKILSSNWSGKVWNDRLWTDRAKVGQKVTAILEEGIPQGFSMQKMTRELQQATGQSFNNAFRLIRTESSFVDSSVRLEEFKQAKEELGYTHYIYDAFLDSRTSEICRELDKQVIPIDEAEIGKNFPPMHPNCRSTCVLDTSSIEDNLDDLMREKEEKTQEEFKPAKSIEEAENYAKNNFVERDFLDKTFKGEVSYKGISLDNANEINKSLYNIYSKYDIKKISGIKSVGAANKAFKSGADAMGAYNIAQKGIFLNKDLLKNAKAFEQYKKKAEDAWNLVMNNLNKLDAEQRAIAEAYKKAGRSLVDNSLRGVITHEMGHHIEWQVLPTKLNNEIGATKSQFAPKISGYANASKSEYLAETFVAYMNGETKIINPEFIKYMNSLKK